MDFGGINEELRFQNKNVTHSAYYYEKGKTPVLVNQSGDLHIYFFLKEDRSYISSVKISQGEDGVYIVHSINVKINTDIDILDNFEQNPKNINLSFFEGKAVDLFEAYKILVLFTEALRDRALDEMNAKIKILDPLDRNYDVLYGRGFFLLNE